MFNKFLFCESISLATFAKIILEKITTNIQQGVIALPKDSVKSFYYDWY